MLLLKRMLYIGIPILLLFACSKNVNPKPITPPPTVDSIPVVTVKNCNIIYAVSVSAPGDTGNRNYFQYNVAGKLTRNILILNDGFTDTVFYSYNGNTIYRSESAGANSSVDTITVNTSGFALHDKQVFATSTYVTDWTYDANMQLTTFTQRQDNYAPYIATYEYTNGDNTLTISAGTQDTLVYDTSKLAVHGNFDELRQLQGIGATEFKNKHLVIMDRHGSILKYNYTFNPEGNIASVNTIFNDKNAETTYYTYECK
jgi:hypothetical protein